jgi:hypothetical protein
VIGSFELPLTRIATDRALPADMHVLANPFRLGAFPAR